jgi:head-tail adaptor
MISPNLNRQLLLEAPVRTPDGAGGFVLGWTGLGLVWADIRSGPSREAAGIGTAVSRVTYRITVRAAPVGAVSRPVSDQRFREGTRVFRILTVAEADPAGRYLVCQTEEEVAA